MSTVTRWWFRAGAALAALLTAVLVPAAAWASGPTGTVVLEAARRRPRGGIGLFGAGALCCLVVVGGIVLIVVLLTRRRR